MRTTYFIFIFFFFVVKSFAQDNAWKKVTFSNLLSLSVPASSIKIDTFLMKNDIKHIISGYRNVTSNGVYAITENESQAYIDITDKNMMNKALKGYKYGFEKGAKEKGFQVQISDTLIDAVLGFKSKVYFQEVLKYIEYGFMAENKSYSFILFPKNNDSAYYDFSKLLGSIRFNKNRNKSGINSNKKSSLFDYPQKLGKSVGYLLVVCTIIGVVIYTSQKKKQKANLS